MAAPRQAIADHTRDSPGPIREDLDSGGTALLQPPGRAGWIVLGGLFLVGLVLRLVFIHHCRFAGDEARFYGEAQAVLDQGWLPALGTSVTGGAARLPGGSFSLLMVPPLLLVRSPLACMVLVVLLSLAAYWLLVSVVRRWMGQRAALVFAILILFSPWSYFYSDRIWNPNVLLLFTAVVLWATTRIIDRPRSRQVFWIPLCLVVVFQFHVSGLLLLALAVTWLLVYRPKIHKAAAGLGAFTGALFYLPYLVSEIQSGFQNTRELFSMPPDPSFSAAEFYRAPLSLLLFSTGEMGYLVRRGFWFPYNEMRFYFSENGLGESYRLLGADVWSGVSLAVSLVSVGVAFLAWVLWAVKLGRAGRGAWLWIRQNPLRLGFVLALVSSTAMLLAARKSLHPHYLYLVYPLAFVPALELAAWLSRGRRFAWVLVWLLFAAGSQTLLAARYYRASERRISFPEQREIMGYIFSSSAAKDFGIELRLKRSRFDTSSFHQLARHYFRRPFRENHSASQRYLVFDREEGMQWLKSRRPVDHGGLAVESLLLDATVVVHVQ